MKTSSFWADVSLTAVTAGFVAVLVGITSSVSIVFQAAQAFGAAPDQLTSWIWALGLGMGLCTMAPSLMLKKPVMVAWSTPGAAVLATAAASGVFNMHHAVGAFLISAALTVIVGAFGWFERIVKHIPMPIASALLAGVLSQFALRSFALIEATPVLALTMLGVYLLMRRVAPRYAVLCSLCMGVMYVFLQGQTQLDAIEWQWAQPVWISPAWSLQATASLALPLFIVTMASQNIPGVAVIRATGYVLPVSKLITMTGVATLCLAPFGGFSLNFSAITAAICMGPEAHAAPEKRYTAAVVCGAIYIVLGLFAGVVAGLLLAFPKSLITMIAGLALLSTIVQGLSAAFEDGTHTQAAVITFFVTLSGITMIGIGSAFWGAIAGSMAFLVLRRQHS